MLYTEDAIKKRKEKSQTLRNKITMIAYILVIPLLIYNISLIAQAIINPYKTPSFLGIKTYTIISGSMEPEINIGDIVVVKEVKEEQLQVGDVISFRQGQSVVTHRIIQIEKTENGALFTTKGDNNNVEDKTKISIDMIEGKTICRILYLGKISRLLQGKVAIIVIAFIVYIYFVHTSKIDGIKNRRKVKRMKYEEKNNIGE